MAILNTEPQNSLYMNIWYIHRHFLEKQSLYLFVVFFVGSGGGVFGLKSQSVGEFFKIFANTAKISIFTAPGFFGYIFTL